ncbi:hypothetical protein QFC21_001016 [Naganishia friedmannii]|uniref:Uncharacterized protein n=1 Tax=Naganishia friedmannii TaxID=89922 RepID=A0ACC2W7E9_9TREE|nr:hypothetical protein QFC21_001016 [Naganishia friedmannii]
MFGGVPKQLVNKNQAPPGQVCQKCYGKGHYTYQCNKKAPVYRSRPSSSARLLNPTKGEIQVDLPDEFKSKKGLADKLLKEREEQRAKELKSKTASRKKRRS